MSFMHNHSRQKNADGTTIEFKPHRYAVKPRASRNKIPKTTEQHHKDNVNANLIMKKYTETGVITHINHAKDLYGDFSKMPDFTDAMQTVASAKANFDQLPAHLRRNFGNDPALFLEFMTRSENIDKIREYGFTTDYFGEAINLAYEESLQPPHNDVELPLTPTTEEPSEPPA